MAKQKANVPAGESKQVKVSLLLPAELQWRMTTIAAKLGRDRSEFAAAMLNRGMAQYKIDKALRDLSGGEDCEGESIT